MKKVQLFFDEPTHTYTDDEGNAYTSVTTVIHKFEKPYPKLFWAYYRAVDQHYSAISTPRPDLEGNRIWCKRFSTDIGRYYTLSELQSGVLPFTKHPDLINLEWELNAQAACERGNKEHNYLEDCVNDMYGKKNVAPSLTVKELQSFSLEIHSTVELEGSPLRTSHKPVYDTLVTLINQGFTIYAEKRVYSYEHRISGTIDILAVNGNGEFYIVDWKTNKDELQFTSGYFKKKWNANYSLKEVTTTWIDTDDRMLAPIDDLQACKGTIYTLQLSLYARLCEMWGLTCLGLVLCHLRIEMIGKREYHHEPHFYDIMYIKEHVDRILDLFLQKKTETIQPKTNNFRKPIKY